DLFAFLKLRLPLQEDTSWLVRACWCSVFWACRSPDEPQPEGVHRLRKREVCCCHLLARC
uniref:Uncharacterized protein n=1 Tax=Monodon monoceros TaxID=40151 RepID=A0A8C6CBP4_MONMO